MLSLTYPIVHCSVSVSSAFRLLRQISFAFPSAADDCISLFLRCCFRRRCVDASMRDAYRICSPLLRRNSSFARSLGIPKNSFETMSRRLSRDRPARESAETHGYYRVKRANTHCRARSAHARRSARFIVRF